MKHLLTALLILVLPLSYTLAQNKTDNKKAATEESINWMTIDEVQVAMKKQPKKVYIDLYTNWCGWCKVMDKKTFSNKEVIAYMNKHFYAVKLNAEQKESIRFLGKVYEFAPQYRANMLAVELANGQLSYPTSIFIEENFQNPQPVPGYLDVGQMEMILKYFGQNLHRSEPFADYQRNFKASWQP